MYSAVDARNDQILVWWLPDYDQVLRHLVDEYQWAWPSMARVRLEKEIPAAVLSAWRDRDPLCARRPWPAVLAEFAAARAEQLGILPRPPLQVACSCCSAEFMESQVPHTTVQRLGVNNLDVCYDCLEKALYTSGSSTSSREVITAVLQVLAAALQGPPKKGDISGRISLKELTRDQRRLAIQALMVKPTPERVEKEFGTWRAAVEHAAKSPEIPLPGHAPRVQVLPDETEFTSIDPARYKDAIGAIPDVDVRSESYYGWEITSLLETGYLALAEAALSRLAKPGDPLTPVQQLAYLYTQTARLDEARTVLKATWEDAELSDYMLELRDLRAITTVPAFYEPLPSVPRGNVRFILVGGPMAYVDGRGDHHCVSGEPGGQEPAADRAESVMRACAMVHSDAWLRAAVELGRALLATSVRGEASPQNHGHLVGHAARSAQQAVKGATGSAPKRLAEGAWTIGSPGKMRWYYQDDLRQYVFNARAGFRLMTVDPAPHVSVWAWPDRSDLVLQAFTDTMTVGASEPATVILPDVAAFRSFARRYVRRQRMADVGRTWMEETLFPGFGMSTVRHARVLSAEFAPSLVIHPDGTEEDGAALAGALAYLDANHAIRLPVWDVLADPLLRGIAAVTPVERRPFALPTSERRDLIRSYRMTYGRPSGRASDNYDVDALLRPYRPTLLDAIQS